MKVRGNVHLIHKLDNLWIFKFITGKTIHRVPFVFEKIDFEDGDELDGFLYEVDGVTYARRIVS